MALLSIESVDKLPNEPGWLSAVEVLGQFELAHRYVFFGATSHPACYPQNLQSPRFSSDGTTAEIVLESVLAKESVVVFAGMMKQAGIAIGSDAQSVLISLNGQPWHAEAEELGRLRESHRVQLGHSMPVGLERVDLQEPFSLWVKLKSPADKSRREWLVQGFDLWCDLLAGGLPPIGMSPGESAVGATSGFLCEPDVFQFSCAGVSADPLAIDLLAAFLRQGWSWASIASIESTAS